MRHDGVDRDGRDKPDETIACRATTEAGSARERGLGGVLDGNAREVGTIDEQRATPRGLECQAAGIGPPAHGVVTHAQQSGTLTDPVTRAWSPIGFHVTIVRLDERHFSAHAAIHSNPRVACDNHTMLDPVRYARQLALPGFGPAELEALGSARVLVIGAGGLGSVVLPQLVGAGVGSGPGGCIGIIDDDVVELSNLHRQTLHGEADLGRSKVDSAAERLVALNGSVTIERHRERFSRENALALLATYDVLVDGSDGFVTRYLAADAAVLAGIPIVWGAVLQYDGQVGVSPAAGPGYRDLFPEPPDPSSVLDCATGGVLPTLCGVIGSIMATQVVALLTGIGETLVGCVTTYDARSGRFRDIAFQHDPHAAPLTGLIDYEAFCGVSGGVSAATPPPADELTALQLAALVSANTAPLLIDVREPWEHDLVAIAGSFPLPLGQLADAVARLPGDRAIVVYCHHGIRSRHALDILASAGVTAQHLIGGIDAWSLQVDPSLERY